MDNVVNRKKSAIQKALDAAHEPSNEMPSGDFSSHEESRIDAVLRPAVVTEPLMHIFTRARETMFQPDDTEITTQQKSASVAAENQDETDTSSTRSAPQIVAGAKAADAPESNSSSETTAGVGAAYDEDSLAIWWKNVHGYPLLGAEREVALAHRIAAGDRAAEKEMIESNLRLVASIARKCRRNNGALSLADLVQEGSLGLIRAVHKFDPNKGYKFSTYASYWIRQAILRAIDEQSRSIRLPVYVIETASKTERARVVLTQELHRPPTSHELAAHLQLTLHKVQEMSDRVPEPISLDTSVGEDDDSVLSDFIEDDRALSPADCAIRAALREELQRAFECLCEREIAVLNFRYGLDEGGHARTLDEVGALLKLTRERVRQIEKIALRRLKQCAQLREIARDYDTESGAENLIPEHFVTTK